MAFWTAARTSGPSSGCTRSIELVLRGRAERREEIQTAARSTATARPTTNRDRGTTRRCAPPTSRSRSALRVRAVPRSAPATARRGGRSRTPCRPARRASRRAAYPRRRRPARPPSPRARASRRCAMAMPRARKRTSERADAMTAGRSRWDRLPGSLRERPHATETRHGPDGRGCWPSTAATPRQWSSSRPTATKSSIVPSSPTIPTPTMLACVNGRAAAQT